LFFTLREEQIAILFENKVMMMVFGHKKGKVTGDLRKINNNDIYDFPSLNIVRAMKLRRLCIRDTPGM
jgi:hypothetical protein